MSPSQLLCRKRNRKKSDSKRRNIEFKLSNKAYTRLITTERCYYTGIKMTQAYGRPKSTDRTIDRIDSSKGYVPGNVVACCHWANKLKSYVESAKPMTEQEAKELINDLF